MKSSLRAVRAVFDTNVLVSSLLTKRSIPRQAFKLAVLHGKVLISVDTLVELERVFSRPKFAHYLTEQERLNFLSNLISVAERAEIVERIQACRDPKDDKFLELAVNGQADYIVTGDDDLLVLHPFREIPILTPRNFLERYGGMQPSQTN